jgi:SnoaL-like domain
VTTPAHPFRMAIESRDPERIIAALHPEVTFHTPLVDVPLRGRDQVLKLFAVLSTVFEGFEFTDELVGDATHALVFRVRVDGHPIEGVDYLRLDEDGRVRSITVAMRPFTSVQALARRMVDPLEDLIASQGTDALGDWSLRSLTVTAGRVRKGSYC